MYFDTAYAPFGETYASSGTLDPAYTGQMNDTAHRDDVAGGLYDFPMREYSIQGRWPSPDPAGVSAACTKNPQTQNRYTYVTNNPLSFVDPLGTYPCNPEDPSCGTCDPSTDPLCGIGFPIGGGRFGDGEHQEGWPGAVAWPVPPFPPGLFSQDEHLPDSVMEHCSCVLVTPAPYAVQGISCDYGCYYPESDEIGAFFYRAHSWRRFFQPCPIFVNIVQHYPPIARQKVFVVWTWPNRFCE